MIQFLWNVIMFLLAAGLVGVFIRLVRGPSIADRAVALDLIAVNVVGMVIVYSVSVNDPIYLVVAMIVALIGFMGTLAFARHIERGVEV